MKNSLFNSSLLNGSQHNYLRGWQVALQNYQTALQEFKQIEPKPRSKYKILKFKKTK
jgi:hypothetical protein